MDVCKRIALFKRDSNLSIMDNKREQNVTDMAEARMPEGLKSFAGMEMRSLMALSRLYQRQVLLNGEGPLLPTPAKPKSAAIRAAYSGVKGAWGDAATVKLFPKAEYVSLEHFSDVFEAVKKGDADYGVVPIQNSRTGAIGETYDLLREHGCYIVARTQLDIKQCLLAHKGAKLKDIRELHSHPEGFSQCSHFLADKSWDLIPESNPAVAALKISRGDDIKLAAIGSRYAAEVYGLDVLEADIMDSHNNKTTFVVIAAQPEYDEKSDHISLTFSCIHRAGSLCEALMALYAGKLNMTRIESRPSSSPDSYRFFAEIEGNIMDKAVEETLRQAAGATEYLEVLGCYKWS
jgi:chorismate mutase/prephenate dehydratase